MSCRIDRAVDGNNRIVLCISGKITGQHVATLRNVLRQEVGALTIDLKNVFLVDREAVQFLALAEYHGAELRNCPMYVREWVTRERADTHAERPDSGVVGTRDDIDDV
jgi:hypothetical protein